MVDSASPFEQPTPKRGGRRFLDALRTDKISGALTLVFGIVTAVQAVGQLAMGGMQKLVASQVPATASGNAVQKLMDEQVLIFTPAQIMIGVALAICGFYVYRGSTKARRVAQAVVLLSFVAVVIVMIWDHATLQQSVETLAVDLPASVQRSLVLAITVISATFNFGLHAALLFTLSRPKSERTSSEVSVS